MQAERQRHWYQNLTPEQREARRIRQRKGFDHAQTMSPEARRARAVKARAAHRSDCRCGPRLTDRGEIDYATLRQWGYDGGVTRHQNWIRSHSSHTPEGRKWREELLEEVQSQIQKIEEEIRAETQLQKERGDVEQALPKMTAKVRIRVNTTSRSRAETPMEDRGSLA
jgi:hypothetical protein